MSEISDLEGWQRLARSAGFEWSISDLEAIRVTLEQVRTLLSQLHELPIRDVEPSVQYRML